VDANEVKQTATEDWLKRNAGRLLRKVGIAEGQRVLDFGCGSGNYTIPAARIIGQRGVIYALDKEPEALDRVMAKAESEKLPNVRRMEVTHNGHIPLPAGSVDVILLYDVLHRGYFPDESDRRSTLTELRRILRRGGWVSFYPTHLRQYGLTFERVRGELKKAGFAVADSGHKRTLIHDDNLIRGRVFNLRKTTRRARGSRRKPRGKAR
jgi:ubiquinone/menaquinone biosynthesis C-methylase UbiE